MQKILIVDDQPEVLRLLEIVLRHEDRELLFAETGIEGLEAARRSRPDLVLLDIMMPGQLDGYDVARELKQDPGTADCTILVITAKVRPQDRDTAWECGAEGYITKPFDVLDLKAKVDALLEQKAH